jgi:hypothetical protein
VTCFSSKSIASWFPNFQLSLTTGYFKKSGTTIGIKDYVFSLYSQSNTLWGLRRKKLILASEFAKGREYSILVGFV